MAARCVVPAATTGPGTVLALVDPAADGVDARAGGHHQPRGPPPSALHDVAVGADEVVAGPDDGADGSGASPCSAGETGLCALQVGVAEAALRRTAAHLNQRHQFGRPLSTFQGTMLRAADAAIDLEAMRVTLWQAAWRLDTGRPAHEAVAVAKWQASERGQSVVHATQHLHGGIGADVTYPIHRYFLWGKQIELMLGGPSRQLAPAWASALAEPVHGRGRAGRAVTPRRRPPPRPAPTTTWPWATRSPSWPSPSPAPSSWPGPSPAATTRTSTTTTSWPPHGARPTSS